MGKLEIRSSIIAHCQFGDLLAAENYRSISLYVHLLSITQPSHGTLAVEKFMLPLQPSFEVVTNHQRGPPVHKRTPTQRAHHFSAL